MRFFPIMLFSVFIVLFSVFIIVRLPAQHKVYVITKYGAIGDGKTANTTAIQKAIDEASLAGGGRVLIPAGKFVTGVLTLKSDVDLHLAANAELLATTKRIDYGVGKASALITANNQKNIAITGNGLIDGQGELLLEDLFYTLKAGIIKDREWQRYNEWGQMRPEERNRPKLIMLANCTNVVVKNITIKNGLCWIQDYRNCTDMVIDSITVVSNTFLNNDGIDLVDCKNVRLTNSFFDVADDGICLKSYDPNRLCENIFIANCKVRSSASAFKMGTASHGGFKNIEVKNISVYDTFRSAIAIETVDGGLIENVKIRDVTAKNTGNAIFIRLGKRQARVAPGNLEDIYIANVKVEIPATKPDAGYSMEGPRELFNHNIFPSSITGIPGHPVASVRLERIEILYRGNAEKYVANINVDSLQKIPEKIADYPEFSMFGELPAWGLYVRHATNVSMKHVKLLHTGKEFRTACIFDDVDELTLDDVEIEKAASIPVIILNQVKNPTLQNLKLPVESKEMILVR